MSLIDKSFVQEKFKDYPFFFCDSNGVYQDSVLESDIENAVYLMSQYIEVSDSLPGFMKLHLLRLVLKLGFNRRHGDTVFKTKPAIVIDYEDTMSFLNALKNGGTTLKPQQQSGSKISLYSCPRLNSGEYYERGL